MTDCQHVPTSEGQSMCKCLDKLMWMRLTLEGMARRVAELEAEAQRGQPRLIDVWQDRKDWG